MSTGVDGGVTRLASVRRWRRVLAGYAGWGWVCVVVVGASLQNYSGGAADPAVLVLWTCWLLTIAAWLVLVVLDRRTHADGLTSLRAEQLVARSWPVPWLRLTACVVLAVMIPLLVQDFAAAAAGALHVGPHVPFTATDVTSDKGGLVVHGHWSTAGHQHSVTVMDAAPRIGSTIQVRRPPFGGPQVYVGGVFAYVGLVILLAVAAAFGLLLRSTHRALVAGRSRSGQVPVWQRRKGRSDADPTWPGLDHRVQVRPHAGTTRKGRLRQPSAYDRNVSMTASGRRFVIVDRSGHAHEFPLAKPHRHEEYAVAELKPITYTRHDGKTGDQEMKTVYLLDGRGTVLAVLPDHDWDHDELASFARDAGLTYSPQVYPTDRALHEALPVLPGTLELRSFSGWSAAALFVLPVVVLLCVFLGFAAN